MQLFVKILFAPLTFALGLVWPVATQVLIAAGLVAPGMEAILAGAAIALPLGLIAQIRGSWIWVK